MKRLFQLALLLLLSSLAVAQNERFDWPVTSVSSKYAPLLEANVPPNSPVLHVCHSPANQVPCTNYATTFTSLGVACANGAQDTPQPQPSACQATGDAQGNIGFWAPPGKYDITVCVENNCFNSPYTVTLGSASASGLDLKTNGVDNVVQSELDMVPSNAITPVDNGDGTESWPLHIGNFGSGCIPEVGSSAIDADLSCIPHAAYSGSFDAIVSNFVTPINGNLGWQGASSGHGEIAAKPDAASPQVFWPTQDGTLLNTATAPLVADGNGNVACPGCMSPSTGTAPVTAYGAVCNGSTDDTSAFTAAIAALPHGGTIVVPSSTSGCFLASTLTISTDGIAINGTGFSYGSSTTPSKLVFATGTSGIVSSGRGFAMKNIYLRSQSSGAGADVGLKITGSGSYLDTVTVDHFGSHGIVLDSTGANVSHWIQIQVASINNFGDGFRFLGGSDTNVGQSIGASARANAGIGFDLVSGASANNFFGPHADVNTGGDYNVTAGQANSFFSPYCESGTGSSFVIGASASSTYVTFPIFGQCTTITNNGGLSNSISYSSGGNPRGVSEVYLPPPPGTAGKVYSFDSGAINATDFSITNQTDSTRILNYNVALGPIWAALKPWYFSNFTAATSGGGTNSGIGGWFAKCWDGAASQTDEFNSQSIGGSGTNGTETLAFTHVAGCGVAGKYTFDGNVKLPSLATTTNCSNAAGPAVCGSAAAGAVAVPTGTNPTLTVNTTAVTATSQIFLTIDESLTIAATTCNTTISTLVEPVVTARSAGVSFTIEVGATLATNPACVSYMIVN